AIGTLCGPVAEIDAVNGIDTVTFSELFDEHCADIARPTRNENIFAHLSTVGLETFPNGLCTRKRVHTTVAGDEHVNWHAAGSRALWAPGATDRVRARGQARGQGGHVMPCTGAGLLVGGAHPR